MDQTVKNLIQEAAELEATSEAAKQGTRTNEQKPLVKIEQEIDNCFEAKEVLNKTEEKFNNESIKQTHGLDENIVFIKQNYVTQNSERVTKIVDKQAAEKCIQIQIRFESERNTENFTANIDTSYKDFVRGDDIDVTKCLKLAESAILAKNFKKAERLIKKSERIYPTKNARELLRNLEAAKKEAIEAGNQTTKINEQTTLLIPKHEIDNCFEAKEVLNKTVEKFNNESIKQTHGLDENIVFIKQNYVTQNSELVTKIVDKQAAEKCIQIQIRFESERNTENFTANIDTSYKDFVRGDDIDVTKCLKLAESAILAKNFKKAERLIKKSERIYPTKNARELLRNLEAAKKEAAEQEATIEAANQTTKINEQTTLLIPKHEIDNCFEAKEVLNKTVEKFNNDSIKQTHDLDENIVLIKQNYVTQNSERVTKVVDKQAAEECIQIAEAALKVTDFIKAERMLLKAKRIDPNINIENLQTRIRIAIAFASSSTAVNFEKDFQSTNARKQNSRECVKISDNYLKQKNIPKAEEFLLKAKNYYNSNNLKKKFEHIEKLKADIDSERSIKIAGPSFVNSNSEACFANDPSQEVPSSYHISKDQDAVTVENHLRNGRSALEEGLLEKAEDYAKKSEQLRTRSATDLLHDIDLVKKIRQDKDFQKSSLRSGYERKIPGASKHSEDMRLIADAKQEISEGKLDNNEELKKAERLKPTENAQQLLQAIEKTQNIQYVGTHNNMQNSPSVTKDNNKHTENNINPKNDIEILVKKAEEAYFANDLDSAETLYKQAYDIFPDEYILSFIKKIKKQKEKTVRPTHGEGVDNLNLQEAKKCVKLAEQARDKGDLDKAECLFIKALRMNPTDDVQNCLKEVQREKESKIYIENLIKDAKAAYFANDLNTAESLFKQAYEIFPDEYILSYINEIQKLKVKILRPILGEGVHNQNLHEAKACVELAEQARDKGDLDKAERLFTKALRINPTDHVRNFLKDVQREKESKLIEKANQEKADMFVSLAVKAFESGANYSAEKYLQKALRWYNSDTTKQMLDTVQKEIKRKINEKKSKCNKKIDQVKEEEMKIEADKHLKIAEEQLKQGVLENARFSALISDSFFPSKETEQLLHLIFNEQCKEDERAEYNEDIKSEKFIECAKSAIAEGDFKLAKKYLMHSNKLKKSVNTQNGKDVDEGKPQKPKQSRQENERRQNQETEAPERTEPTTEQVEAIRRVREAKDDYEILGLNKQSGLSDVKKAFRRLTLLLHPDKNRAAGAKEAFMLASEASERLKKKLSSKGRR